MKPDPRASVRKATMDDVGDIARIHVDAWRETYAEILPADFLKRLSYEDRKEMWSQALSGPSGDVSLWVVDVDAGSIGGFAAVGPERGQLEGYSGELYAIYLLQQYQGRGFGRALFSAAVVALINVGYQTMGLWVLEENRSRGFYEHLGGAIVGRQMIQIGEMDYTEIAYGWQDLTELI